ncbi:MAG: hypothetical protein AAF389_07310 [Gemmatimonadota bacterium]
MSRTVLERVLIAALIIFAVLALLPALIHAQATPTLGPPTMRHLKLSGPRFGMTTFTGAVAEARRSAGSAPVMSQFGWQFETQIAASQTGGQALLEWVFLVGGWEDGSVTGSLTWLAGYRLPSGFEVGAGPSLSVHEGQTIRDPIAATTSMVVAAGATAPVGQVRVPANIAVAFARGGPRITLLLGWIIHGL